MAAHTFADGNYDMSEIRYSLNSDFKNEKELCDYIEGNIERFSLECLGVEYLSHTREYPIKYKGLRTRANKRIDFLIVTKDQQRIGIECKNPRYDSEVTASIGQCLTYLHQFDKIGIPLTRMVIVCTRIDIDIPFVLDMFNLPLTFIGFDKDKFLTYQNGSSKR